jgi:serine kinase of HPr protein (carbohydrate metabolism regulator)
VTADASGIRHAGLIARRRRGFWRGVLIEGPSGCGKSDLALRALSEGFRLVADDRVVLWVSGARLFGRAPDTLQGALEVRGLDVVRQPAVAMSQVVLVVRSGVADRIPQLQAVELHGISTPLLECDLGAPSAPAKLSRALDLFDGADNKRI